MTDGSVSHNSSENPEPQEKPSSGNVITPFQEQPRLPDRLPSSLIERLASLNPRYLALNQEMAYNTINVTEYKICALKQIVQHALSDL